MESTKTVNLPKGKKIPGQPYLLPRLGVGDKIRIGTNKTGVIVGRTPQTAVASGSTTVQWTGGDKLTYQWADWPKMILIWEGETRP